MGMGAGVGVRVRVEPRTAVDCVEPVLYDDAYGDEYGRCREDPERTMPQQFVSRIASVRPNANASAVESRAPPSSYVTTMLQLVRGVTGTGTCAPISVPRLKPVTAAHTYINITYIRK